MVVGLEHAAHGVERRSQIAGCGLGARVWPQQLDDLVARHAPVGPTQQAFEELACGFPAPGAADALTVANDDPKAAQGKALDSRLPGGCGGLRFARHSLRSPCNALLGCCRAASYSLGTRRTHRVWCVSSVPSSGRRTW